MHHNGGNQAASPEINDGKYKSHKSNSNNPGSPFIPMSQREDKRRKDNRKKGAGKNIIETQ